MRFPTPIEAPGPSSTRLPRSVTPMVDTTAEDIAQGVGGLARGVQQGANALDQMAGRQLAQENAVDLSRAEAFKTAAFLDIQNEASKDNNLDGFEDRYTPRVTDTVGKAAALIRDPRVRERWAADQQSAALTMSSSIASVGTDKRDALNRVTLENTLRDQMRIGSDPTVPSSVRDKYRRDMLGSVAVGLETGLLTPAQAEAMQESYIRGMDRVLSQNIAELDILDDPQRALTGLAIPQFDGRGSVLDAQLAVDGGMMLEPSLGAVAAELLGDANFPTDPGEVEAYLSDPVKANDYAEVVQAHLSDRYRGDLTAVVIAMDPQGGTELADKWVASRHDVSVLPRPVRERFEEVMNRMTSVSPTQRIPITAAPGVDLSNIDTKVLTRFEQVQSMFGTALPVVTSSQSTGVARRGIEIDVSALSEEARAKLISMASTSGFTGIGITEDRLQLDTGDLRTWGDTPAWAKDVLDAHNSGQVDAIPQLYNGVAPEYAAMSFDQRLALHNKAKAAMSERNINMRASLVRIAENAPAAIQSTGVYEGDMPTATQFVQAYGAEEGIQRYQQFNTSVDTSKQVFAMKTMTNADVAQLMQEAVPRTSGNNAALEAERYRVIQTAGKSVLDARAADPAGYVLDAVPSVAAIFEAANEDPSQMVDAIIAMSEAQRELGIEEPKLLPAGLAASVVESFNDRTLPAQERMAGVAQVILSAQLPEMQDQIFNQLVEAKLPAMTAGVINAIRRGDEGAAATLMRAALFDPNDISIKLPQGQSDADIQNAIMQDVFSPGMIGAVTYGTIGASGDSFDQIEGASQLIFNDVKQRLLDGSAGGNLDRAVELAIDDMFGDDIVLRGNGSSFLGIGAGTNLNVTVPPDVPDDMARKGFNNLATTVRSSLRHLLMSTDDPRRDIAGGAEAARWSIDNYVDSVMAEGYFANGDGHGGQDDRGYVFFDPNIGGPVIGPDGKALVFTLSDVIAASGGVDFSTPRDR